MASTEHAPIHGPAPSTREIGVDLPRGGKLTLRPVTKDDEPFLLALYGSTRDEELSQIQWGEGQRELFLRWQFDLQQREYYSRFPDGRYELIVVDGHAAGRFWTGSDETQIRLLDIALLPEFQKRGVGTALLKELIKEAQQVGKPLRHMVFVLNDNAHRFYERLGFVLIDEQGAYKHMEWRPDDQLQTSSTT